VQVAQLLQLASPSEFDLGLRFEDLGCQAVKLACRFQWLNDASVRAPNVSPR